MINHFIDKIYYATKLQISRPFGQQKSKSLAPTTQKNPHIKCVILRFQRSNRALCDAFILINTHHLQTHSCSKALNLNFTIKSNH